MQLLILLTILSFSLADRYIYSNIFPCNYYAGEPTDETWIIRAPLGEPKCHTFSGNLSVYTINHTWGILPFYSNRLVIYDWGGCVEYFSDNECHKFIDNDCLDNTTYGSANVTLHMDNDLWIHYDIRCYCFETKIGPCKSL